MAHLLRIEEMAMAFAVGALEVKGTTLEMMVNRAKSDIEANLKESDSPCLDCSRMESTTESQIESHLHTNGVRFVVKAKCRIRDSMELCPDVKQPPWRMTYPDYADAHSTHLAPAPRVPRNKDLPASMPADVW